MNTDPYFYALPESASIVFFAAGQPAIYINRIVHPSTHEPNDARSEDQFLQDAY